MLEAQLERDPLIVARRPSGAARAVKLRKRPMQEPRVQENSYWVDCVLRIRDKQDQVAFADLFSHFAPRVKFFLMKSGASETMAEECAQEVMAKLWHKTHLFDPNLSAVSTWIFTIARNQRADAIRKQNRPEPEDLPWGPEPVPEAADVMVIQQETEQIKGAVAALPEKQKEIVKLAFYGDLTHQEISQKTGLPLGTIKGRIRLALERLRREVK